MVKVQVKVAVVAVALVRLAVTHQEEREALAVMDRLTIIPDQVSLMRVVVAVAVAAHQAAQVAVVLVRQRLTETDRREQPTQAAVVVGAQTITKLATAAATAAQES